MAWGRIPMFTTLAAQSTVFVCGCRLMVVYFCIQTRPIPTKNPNSTWRLTPVLSMCTSSDNPFFTTTKHTSGIRRTNRRVSIIVTRTIQRWGVRNLPVSVMYAKLSYRWLICNLAKFFQTTSIFAGIFVANFKIGIKKVRAWIEVVKSKEWKNVFAR